MMKNCTGILFGDAVFHMPSVKSTRRQRVGTASVSSGSGDYAGADPRTSLLRVCWADVDQDRCSKFHMVMMNSHLQATTGFPPRGVPQYIAGWFL